MYIYTQRERETKKEKLSRVKWEHMQYGHIIDVRCIDVSTSLLHVYIYILKRMKM